MLFEKNICLSTHGGDSLDLAYFQSEVIVGHFAVSHFENFSEVAHSKFLDHFKVQKLQICLVLSKELYRIQACRFVLWPMLFLTCLGTVINCFTVATSVFAYLLFAIVTKCFNHIFIFF